MKPAERKQIEQILGRPPSPAEAGIFGAMWSEHCSYRSSKRWLKLLPGEGAGVISGPGGNAGIIDIGDGDALAFKMESHNHPSFIDPFNGAATGVGGIMRDIFTMGARPVAFLNSLNFGAAAHEKTQHLLSGVVSGISAYGNCVGVPTVGGEVNFDASFNGNILVNVLCAGIVRRAGIFHAAMRSGALAVYVGARTGRDGIEGAVMASAGFSADKSAARSAVQTGDPFMQKLLLEASLEIFSRRAALAAQDMGAAGLTSSSVEMAGSGGAGLRLDLDKVPCREEGMSAVEIMLSESQERMLFAVAPGHEGEVAEICAKWGLESVVIGEATDDGFLTITHKGKQEAHIPVMDILESQPVLERPYTRPDKPSASGRALPDSKQGSDEILLRLLNSPEFCSKRWIWEQYDHMVMGDTIQPPGSDAAVVRIHGTRKALALVSEATPAYCRAHAGEGARQAVAEARRNLIAVGARPLALTNCLNFGNPEKAPIMGQFAVAVEGLAEAAGFFEMPVVSGNVSFYNETGGEAITPMPVIGAVGLFSDYASMMTPAFKHADEMIFVAGECDGHLERSAYASLLGEEDGAMPEVDLAAEQKIGEFIRCEILGGALSAVHDISRGGLAIAAAEMALAGNMGAEITLSLEGQSPHALLFCEDQARYLITCPQDEAAGLLHRAEVAGIGLHAVGRTGGENLTLPAGKAISLRTLREAHENWLPNYLGHDEQESR